MAKVFGIQEVAIKKDLESKQDLLENGKNIKTINGESVLGEGNIVLKTSTEINLNTYVPSTATNGTLDSSVLATLQASDSNYIVFNNEIFKLADKQHNEGYLVYSHNGHDTTGCFFQKCITITISTRGWILETQENQAKLTAGSGITIKNNVISSTGGSGGGITEEQVNTLINNKISVQVNDDDTIDLTIN